MSESWVSLYVNASDKDVLQSLHNLYKGANRIILVEESEINEVAKTSFREMHHDSYPNDIIHFLISIEDNPWVYVTGFGDLFSDPTPDVYASDLVRNLSCDAVYIGFIDTYSWWFYLYRGGKLVDVFDSDPVETLFAQNYYLEPEDPRILYNKKLGSPYNYNFPEDLLQRFNRDPLKLMPLLRPGADAELIEKAFKDRWPERAIAILSRCLVLPGFGQHLALDILDSKWPDEKISIYRTNDEFNLRDVGVMVVKRRL